MRESYRRRRDAAATLLDEAGLLVSRPHGAFYLLADISPTGLDGYEFCKRLILEYGVAVAPGETFGPGGHGKVRISLATKQVNLEEGTRRFAQAVRAWT